jgi:hypothetical protein
MVKNYRFRHLTAAVNTCSWNMVLSVLTRILNFLKYRIPVIVFQMQVLKML